MATTAAAKAPADLPQAEPKKKSKLALIAIIAAVLLAAAAGAAWWFLGRSSGDDEEEPRAASKPAVFLPVDQFTVNLQPDDGGQQFLQVAMTLKVEDQETVDAIKALLPEVRSRVLLLLSSKKASQLTSPEGKTKLAEEIIREVSAPLPQSKHRAKPVKKAKADPADAKSAKKKAKAQPAPEEQEEHAPERVQAVYFTHFIIQ
jgi:flagellar FliL protein